MNIDLVHEMTNNQVNNIEHWVMRHEEGDERSLPSIEFHLLQAGIEFRNDEDALEKANLVLALWYNWF